MYCSTTIPDHSHSKCQSHIKPAGNSTSLPSGDIVEQLDLHDAHHGHDGDAAVPGHAAPLHLEGPRLRPRLLGDVQAESRGAQEHPRNCQRRKYRVTHQVVP